jgi:hypothetical protein
MKLSFDLNISKDDLAYSLLETFPAWIFVVDIIFNFNTAYYSKGNLCFFLKIGTIHRNRKDIIKYYFRTNFLWDLIVVVPFILG